MRYKKYLAVIFLVVVSLSLSGQNSFNALAWKNATAYNAYLLREVHRQYATRQTELAKALQTKNEMMKFRGDLKGRYQEIFGNLPVNTPLNAKVLKSTQQLGFRVEAVVFESMPKMYVTANLYLPDGPGPFPATLELCGHGLGGKIGSPPEAILMARNGIAVLVVDPVGQGERVQLLDSAGKPATRGATTEHTLLNASCNLIGSSLAAFEWWDNHRAIDYLESRPDIDKNRLGVFGSSGGGTQTAYLIGLEERLKVASICSYFSQRERVLELSGPSDGCQHIPGEGAARLEIADWVTMFAPKPVLIMSGTYDFVDYQGALQGFGELQKVYEVLRVKDQIRMFTAESGHGMPKVKREALTTWFRSWLCKDTAYVHETTAYHVADSLLQCTPTGQVNTAYADALTLPGYNLSLFSQYGARRMDFMKQDAALVRHKVMELLRMTGPEGKVLAEPTGTVVMRTYSLHKYQLIRKGQMPVPCVVVVPEKIAAKANVVLCLNENGKEALLNDESTIGNYVNRGDILVVADLRGYGETADPANLNDNKYWNREYRNAMISLHIGRPIVGQRVLDVLTLLDFISGDSVLLGHPIHLLAEGSYGPVAIHAAFLDTRILHTEVIRSIKSYEELLKNPMMLDQYTQVIPGVLKYYDLKDLIEKAGKQRIQFMD